MTFWIALAMVVAGSFKWVEQYASQWYRNVNQLALLSIKSIAILAFAWMCLANIFASDFNPFIYFKF